MSGSLDEIVRRRRALAAEAQQQRAALAAQVAALRQSFAFVELARRGYLRLKGSPLIGVALAAGLIVLGPGRLLRLGYRSGLLVVGLLRLMRMLRVLR